MKTAIFYFSGTGNSLAVAKILSEHIDESSMFPILSREVSDIEWCEIDKAIFVHPIYMNYIPAPFESFLKRIDVPKNIGNYIVTTHGGTQGVAGAGIVDCFNNNDIRVDGYYEVEIINNTPKGVAPKFLMRLDWEKDIVEDKVSEIVMGSTETVKNIALSISSNENGILDKVKTDAGKIDYKIMKLIRKLAGSKPPKLSFVLDESCTGCGTCEKVCLADRISMEDKHPQWKTDHCYYCYACFNFCPAQAIGVKHYTKKMGRYHHPDITSNDIAGQKK